MKKLKKILSLSLSTLLLNSNVFAASEEKISLPSGTKYLGILGAVIVIILIIFLSYKSDKKSEYDDDEYEDEEFDEEEKETQQEEEKYEVDTSLNEETEYEEEALFDSANDYVEEDEELIEENFETKEKEEIKNEVEDLVEDVADEPIEDIINETEDVEIVEEDTDNILNGIEEYTEEKKSDTKTKKFTRKKIEVNEEIDLDSIEEDDDDDTGVPTFDELLKQSEENEDNDKFDFASQMEANLKKNQKARLDKKTTTKKSTTKKSTTKKATTTKKKKDE